MTWPQPIPTTKFEWKSLKDSDFRLQQGGRERRLVGGAAVQWTTAQANSPGQGWADPRVGVALESVESVNHNREPARVDAF